MRFLATSQRSTSLATEASDLALPTVAAHVGTRARASWLAPALLLLAVAVFGLLTLTNFPSTFVDEGSNSNRAWSLLQTGHAFASVDNGVYQQYGGYWTYFPYLGALIHAAFIWVFGLNVASIRLASVVFGLVLLLVVYIIARRLYDFRTGLIAMALLAISAPFVESSHLGRHDIIVAALGYGAVAFYVTDRNSALSLRSVLSGLALGLALDIHFNILIFGPALLALYLLDYGPRFFRTGRFWGFVGGGLLGVLFFVTVHILPYPQTYFALATLGNGTSRTPPIFTFDPALWHWSFIGTIDMLDLMLVPIMVPAVIFLVRRQSRADARIYWLLGTLVVAVAAIIKYKADYYGILIAPAVSLLIAPYLGYSTQRVGRVTDWVFWRNVLAIGSVTAAAVVNLSPAARGSDAEYRTVLDYVQHTIPAGSLTYGSPTYWLALPSSPYINWEQLIFRQRQMPGGTFTGAVQAAKPDYLILDGYTTTYTYDDDSCASAYRNIACIPKREFDVLLAKQAILVGELKTNDFGDIRIYKMDWGKSPVGAGK